MSLTCGLVGLPLSGKTTLFNLLTKANAETSSFLTGKTETNRGTAFIPDERIDYLSNLYLPRKTTYAKIEYVDVPGLKKEGDTGRRGANQFLTTIRDVDALVYVLRVFGDPGIEHVDGVLDPYRDWNTIEMELLIADLDIIERNIERIKNGRKITKENQLLLDVLTRCQETLEAGIPIHTLAFNDQESAVLQGYSFFTGKPYLVVANVDDEQLLANDYKGKKQLMDKAKEVQVPLVELSAKIEVEIDQLDHQDKQLFMDELGITVPGINLLAQATYGCLGLTSFFTVGDDEVKAWTIERGINAKKAAGKIHSDIEKGFIRAEVIGYDDLHKCGNAQKAKEQGHYRLEGKEYIVLDGDIINFRFNV